MEAVGIIITAFKFFLIAHAHTAVNIKVLHQFIGAELLFLILNQHGNPCEEGLVQVIDLICQFCFIIAVRQDDAVVHAIMHRRLAGIAIVFALVCVRHSEVFVFFTDQRVVNRLLGCVGFLLSFGLSSCEHHGLRPIHDVRQRVGDDVLLGVHEGGFELRTDGERLVAHEVVQFSVAAFS